jgi:hypothetical protein
MNRVDDANAPARDTTVDGLSVLQVRIHSCRRFQEPGSQVLGRVLRVPRILRDRPSRRQRRHLHAEPNQCMTMRDEVIRIGHPVALNVGLVRRLRVRPPIVAFGEVVVLASGAALS